jgi:hypothetical protein
MSLVNVDGGESLELQYLVNKATPQNLVLCLYKNNITPAETDTIVTYTEADFTGYANVNLTGANWTISGTAPTSAGYAQQSFTSSASAQNQNVYGYFYKRATGGELIIAERFSDGPYNIVNNGDVIKVTPTITCD